MNVIARSLRATKQSRSNETTLYLYHANKRNGTLYTGVTSDLVKRVHKHKNAAVERFAKKYDCKLLVYYESHESMDSAITREKQIKAGSREKKLELIEEMNPDWEDLYSQIL